MDRAQANLEAALTLLQALANQGLRLLVLCPGSRSGPLAVAAGLLERRGLALVTAIDERSAAFFALGHSRATGLPAAVITTSGTAVANLLPAVVEADYGAIPLLLLTADRPPRLKGCGANQTVNQEDFLLASLRWQGLGDGRGLHAMAADELEAMAATAFRRCLGTDQPTLAKAIPEQAMPDQASPEQVTPAWAAPGAVQLNLPIDEPLHASSAALLAVARALPAHALAAVPLREVARPADLASPGASPLGCQELAALNQGAGPQLGLDPDRPGLIVAGPWRGRPQTWPAHVKVLRQLQRRTGWPLLADALSGLRGIPDLAVVAGYDLLLASPKPEWRPEQVLRLGPVPASRRLQHWLTNFSGPQALISEADPRNLDGLGTAPQRCSSGLAAWWGGLPPAWHGDCPPAAANRALAQRWQGAEQALQAWLDSQLATPLAAPGTVAGIAPETSVSRAALPRAAVPWSAVAGLCEPALARQLSRLLPAGVPLVLANSSPVRDWESFAVGDGPPRPVLAFRGASGIDGTLSLACGVAQACGRAVLISGDLALLHDANGWLWRSQLTGQLTILVLDNGGGGIFEQLPIRPDPAATVPAATVPAATDPAVVMDFERLFAMPQPVDPLALAAVHGVPGRLCGGWEELERDLSWALGQPLALLRLVTDRRQDAQLRQQLRQQCQELPPKQQLKQQLKLLEELG